MINLGQSEPRLSGPDNRNRDFRLKFRFELSDPDFAHWGGDIGNSDVLRVKYEREHHPAIWLCDYI